MALMPINFDTLPIFSRSISIRTRTGHHADGTDITIVTIELLRGGEAVYSAEQAEPKAPGSLARTLAAQIAGDPLFKFDTSGTPLSYDGTRWINALDELNAWGAALKATLGIKHDKAIHKEGWVRDVMSLSFGLNPPHQDEFSTMGSCPGIPCRDGILVWDGSDFSVEQHNPDYRNLFVLPVHIDAVRENIRYPEEGTLLRRYFDENLCDADRKFLPQWLGLHLIQHCLAKRAGEHFLLLQGDGGNGKSVIIDMIAGLVGYDAVATESLDGLNERTTHQLIGKVAMLAPENKGDWDLKLLNRLVSQEIIPSRPLYRDPAPFRPRLLVTQACNRPPVFNEKSRALERRMLVMQLTKVFDTSKGVIEDLGRVIAESEYAVLAGCALWGAKQIFENGGRLDIPEQLKAQGKKLARNGVQLEEFVEHLEFGEFAISKKELLTFYLQWMSEENRSKQGMNMSSLIDGLQVIAARDHGPILVQNGISIGIQRTGRREGYTEVAAGPEMEVAGRNVGYSPIKDERGTEIKLAKREELIYGVRIKEGVIDSEPVGIDWKGGPDRTCASKDDQGELPGIQSAADTEIAELKARIAELEARKAS